MVCFVHVGPLVFPHSFAQPESSVFASGVSRLGLSLSIFDAVHIDSPLLLHSFSCIGFAVSVVGLSHLGPLMLPRSLA